MNLRCSEEFARAPRGITELGLAFFVGVLLDTAVPGIKLNWMNYLSFAGCL